MSLSIDKDLGAFVLGLATGVEAQIWTNKNRNMHPNIK
jgi:hypothetical protein